MRFAGDSMFTDLASPNNSYEAISSGLQGGARVSVAKYGAPYTPLDAPQRGLGLPSTEDWMAAGQGLSKLLNRGPAQAPITTPTSVFDAPLIDWQSTLQRSSPAG